MQIQNHNISQTNQLQYTKPIEKTPEVKVQQKEVVTLVKQENVETRKPETTSKESIQSVLATMQHQVKNEQVRELQQENNSKKVNAGSETSGHYQH